MTFFDNSIQITASYAQKVALERAAWKGMDRAEVLGIWKRLGRDEDAREMITDITDGEIEIVVEN